MTQGTNDVANVDRSPSWWSEEADEVEGYDLVRDEALITLVGVPFKITSVIFRDGIQRKDVPYREDYVSVELTVAPPEIFRQTHSRITSRRIAAKVNGMPLAMPEEQLVVNDGSTGIYRQITQYLAAKELITLPEGRKDGEKGESVYDLPRSQWLAGADKAGDGIDIALKCSRGLRFSDYTNEYLPAGETARTWYIA